MTTFSLNEVEVMAKRAARGVGYNWGMAEEAGKAIRWLCSFELNGCEALIQLLKSVEHSSESDMRAIKTNGVWASNNGELCPLLAGSILSDFAFQLKEHSVLMGKVLQPMIILPFAAAAARQLQSTISLNWNNLVMATDGCHVDISDDANDLSVLSTENITIGLGKGINNCLPLITRVEVPNDIWDELNTLAHRTYAPATEESRILGAGAEANFNS